jgi:uncharacterized protein (DUF488 family)
MSQSSPTSVSIFTIGHSNLELAEFLAVLTQNGVQIVCDVRSRPGSYRYPQFNRECLEAELASVNIRYEFLGESLGGRPSDPRAYHEDGRVDYAARRRAADFAEGVDRAVALSRDRVPALMCAEEDPLHCHRFLMICPALLERGVTPVHIRRGGALESQREAEDRLLALNELSAFMSDSLFAPERGPALEEALRRQALEHAFRSSYGQAEEI